MGRLICKYCICCLLLALLQFKAMPSAEAQSGPIVIIDINGPINPATDDFLGTSLTEAEAQNARLFIIQLNTPGGLLPSMKAMVEKILESPVPVLVYVTPSGGSAMSAGVFITLAGHFAAMAPGTTIGAAHPVTGTGDDIGGDMRTKIENSTVSQIRAIAEQRGRNADWAEEAVRDSVAITDRDALDEKVIDFIASDIDRALDEIEGKTVSVDGKSVVLKNLKNASRKTLEMSFKQQVVNILSDPNIAILLGLGAMLGIGLELYHPGGFLPGIIGVICLVLSLTAAQVLPINFGGLILMILGVAFFVVELMLPAFGIWGGAGIVCLILGSIYFIDTKQVWSIEGFDVNIGLVGGTAALVGLILLAVGYLVVRSAKRQISTGKEGLLGRKAVVKGEFKKGLGRVQLMGEIWRAKLVEDDSKELKAGDELFVVGLEEEGMCVLVSGTAPTQ